MFCSSSTRVERRVPLIRCTPSFPFGLFPHHSNRDNSLVMPPSFVRQLRNNTAQSLVLRTQGLPHGKNKRTSACISKMKAKFLSCGKRSTKNQGEQLQLVVVEAKGACVRRKLGAHILAALRLALRICTFRL